MDWLEALVKAHKRQDQGSTTHNTPPSIEHADDEMNEDRGNEVGDSQNMPRGQTLKRVKRVGNFKNTVEDRTDKTDKRVPSDLSTDPEVLLLKGSVHPREDGRVTRQEAEAWAKYNELVLDRMETIEAALEPD